MAIRYSGDVEVRVLWDARARVYRATVRDPLQGRMHLQISKKLLWLGDPRSSTNYDRASREALHVASKDARRRGKVLASDAGHKIRRGFQAACPARVS